MSLTKIYVGNIAYAATEPEIRQLFLPYGTIEDLAMAEDRETGKFRGFAIVMMPDADEAAKAIAGVDGQSLRGRQLVVNTAVKKKNKGEQEEPGETGPVGDADGRATETHAGASMPRRVRARAEGTRPRRSGRNPRRG